VRFPALAAPHRSIQYLVVSIRRWPLQHFGRRIVFDSDRAGGVPNLWWQAADGAGAAERLTTSGNQQSPGGITPDGSQVVFYENTPTMARDLMRLALDSSRRVAALLQTPFDERNGVVSPDGRWLAYESNSGGRVENGSFWDARTGRCGADLRYVAHK
jgi:Tol biopolymer transport system component